MSAILAIMHRATLRLILMYQAFPIHCLHHPDSKTIQLYLPNQCLGHGRLFAKQSVDSCAKKLQYIPLY